MKVYNMTSPKGNKVANQFIIEGRHTGRFGLVWCEAFQSYDSMIAKKIYDTDGLKVVLDEYYWDYSKTTGQYRNQFLGEGIAETRKKIESGEYKLANLN